MIRSKTDYEKKYKFSIDNTESFYESEAKNVLVWNKMFSDVRKQVDDKTIWFYGGMLNACYNAVDVHAMATPDKIAFIYSGNDGEIENITYSDLLIKVCQYSNFFKSKKLVKGDCVTIYAANHPDVFAALLACSRLGIIINCVFGGFSPSVLASRIDESKSKILITFFDHKRANSITNFYQKAKEALEFCENKEVALLILNKNESEIVEENNVYWSTSLNEPSTFVECVPVESNHPLMYIFTSGSTGRPKGTVHGTAGYLLETAMTLRDCFKFTKDDTMFCTADIGWLAAMSHSFYGPLLLGSTSIIFGGTPLYPDPLRIFDIIQKFKCTQFYTAPTVVRLLNKFIKENLGVEEKIKTIYNNFSDTIKVLGCVGEPLSSKSYEFMKKYFGENITIINTYWQTETGRIMLSQMYKCGEYMSGSVGVPFYGVEAAIMKIDTIEEIKTPNEKGVLVFKDTWPGRTLTFVNDWEGYKKSYLEPYPGYYYTSDEAVRDDKGNFYVLGRIDDVININGHRLSTLEVEHVTLKCLGVAEAAVIPKEDGLSGQAMCIFVVPLLTYTGDNMKNNILKNIRDTIGPIIKSVDVVVVPDIPKTRTGKIMRRVLRKIINNEDLGDCSSCANLDAISNIKSLLANQK